MKDDVLRAQAKDPAAFARLVARYGNMVRGYAAGWVGDAADDVAQDVFVDAYLRLDQLEDPARFGGWLRRITHKHCDRRTRRRRVTEVDTELVAPAEPDVDGAWLLDAIERLPAHERIVVALHYLGDEPQKDVADFLGLPLSTVKKRLHTARGRLAKRRPEMIPTPETVSLEDRVALFVALRAGDRDTVRAIVKRRPALLEAAEHYTDEEAFAANLPLSHRLTPLILAAGRGDEAMVALLLEHGADPDATCGCDAHETALFAAALRGRERVVAQLLDAGADPTRTNHVGFTAADVARMRRHEGVVQRLDGARPKGVMSEGPTDATGAASMREGRRASAPAIDDRRLVTGIRALDLLAPLERGTIVRVHGAAETGLTVLLAELSARFAAMGGHSVWTSGGTGAWQGPSLEEVVRDLGIERHTTVVGQGALAEVEASSVTRDPVALFVFLGDAPEAEVEAALAAFRDTATITFVIDPWVEVTRGVRAAPTLAAPYDAVIRTSRALADAGVYPALDAAHTDSAAAVPSRHEAIRAAVRTAMSTDAGASGVARHFAQWFSVVRTDTGHPGEVSTLEETLEGFATVVGLG